MPHQIAGKILASVSTCKVVVIAYPSDTATLADAASGSLDVVIVAKLSAKTIEAQGGKIIASTARSDDANWKHLPTLVSIVPGAVLYTQTTLLANSRIRESDYQNLVTQIKSVWDNIDVQKQYIISDGDIFPIPLFGDECTKYIRDNITELAALAQKFGFQQ